MVRLFRRGKGRKGLVLANGGVLTYHHAVVMSNTPPGAHHRIPGANPLKAVIDDIPIPPLDTKPHGAAAIEVSLASLGSVV